MSELPPFFQIGPPPPELELETDDGRDEYSWRRAYDYDRDPDGPAHTQTAEAFPEAIAVDPSTAKMFACSGSPDSFRYREATRFLPLSDMTWEEARVALNRLVVDPSAGYVRLAEFALAADGYAGFVGKKGDHAAKLREALADARSKLHLCLYGTLETARSNTIRLARPITSHGKDLAANVYDVKDAATAIVQAFRANVPTAPDQWVRIARATPEQVLVALGYLRSMLATWEKRRPDAESVSNRLKSPDLPTAAEYAEAVHIADMLDFTSEKLLSLYAGIIYSMPIYRLYPGLSEAEAIDLWWPWGQSAGLIDSRPPQPSKPRKKNLDPSIVTAKRPQDVVREVMQKTGINRTTAQRLTATMRKKMRQERENRAEHLLRLGQSKSAVARAVGLSSSRISAMFKGNEWGNQAKYQKLSNEMLELSQRMRRRSQ